jgi:hypothetical protein
VSPRAALRKSLFLPGLRSLALLLSGGLGLLVVVVGGGLAVRPELWMAGPDFVARAIATGVGTGAGTLFPAVGAGLGFTLASGLSGGWAALGMGPVRLWARLAPLWTICVGLGVVLSFVVEPVSWSAVGGVRGVPLAAKVSWERLTAGEVLTTSDGGWVRHEATDGLELRSGDGEMHLRASKARPESATTSWQLEDVTLNRAGGAPGRWTFGLLSLSMEEEAHHRYHAPATSPWALSFGQLAAARARSDRAARVWFRRWLQVVSVPILALAMWLLALPQGRRAQAATGPRRLAAAVLGPPALGLGTVLSFFLLLRIAEQLSFPAAVLVLPVLPPLGLIVWLLRR